MNYTVKNLGDRQIINRLLDKFSTQKTAFVSDDVRVLYNVCVSHITRECSTPEKSFELAGPREKIFFDPSSVRCAIVTCGGLCPGINDVIRSIVMESYYSYGVRSVLGIRYGFNGLNPEKGYEPVELTQDNVDEIHKKGGTILGSSRGGTDNMELIVDRLHELGVNILFTIGGDGTLRGAHEISKIAQKRGIRLSVIGVPKTIDNDISFTQRSFGFETAFSTAVESISSAHTEAKGAPNGIGLVKLMGRHSGFIASNATLAMNDVNFVLVPEILFDLDGENGFMRHLEDRIIKRNHAVICVAEGAGQDLMARNEDNSERDASGNIKLMDIGIFLRDKIREYFTERDIEVNLKYIDPSYIIRSAPANANDSIFCAQLGQFAVHAGMAGKTDMIVAQWNNIYTHVPIDLAISSRKQIDPDSRFWYTVLEATGQPVSMVN